MTEELDYPADAIIILGGGVNMDGTLTQMSQTRVERGIELFHAEIAPHFILAGKCSLHGPVPPVTEAAAMADYARSKGVPAEALLLEEESRDTLGNAYFTREMYLVPNAWTSVRVVTSDFHLSRAAWVFRKVLGGSYDYSFVSAYSGLTPRELIFRALEECKLSIFLNEWLEAVQDADEHAIERLIRNEHPGYAEAPTLSHDEMRERIDEIAHINQIEGTQRWLAEEGVEPRDHATVRRRVPDRRTPGHSHS